MLARKWDFVLDTREKADIKELFRQKNYSNGKEMPLATADIACIDKTTGNYLYLVGFEHKRIGDLIQSIQSQRLFGQIRACKKHYPILYLVITGDLQKQKATLARAGLKVNENVIYGTLASLTVRDGVNVIWLPGPNDLLEFAFRVSEKVAQGKYGVGARLSAKTEMADPVLWLESIPGITRDKSRELLGKKGSLQDVMETSIDDLQCVNGIGPETARRLYEIFRRQYPKIETAEERFRRLNKEKKPSEDKGKNQVWPSK